MRCTHCVPRTQSTQHMQRTACSARPARDATSARTQRDACSPHFACRACITRYATYARIPRSACRPRLACIACLPLFCVQCMHTTPCVEAQNSRSIHSLASKKSKTSAVSVTHCCKSSADREQLGCHNHPIARRSRHRIETCDSPSRSDCQGSRRDAIGSQLTKGGNIGFGNLRCARRTNCSTVASRLAQPSANAPPLRGMEGTRQPCEAGKTACHFRNFLMFAPGHVNRSPYLFEGQNIFHSIGSEHRGQKDSHEPHGW